MRADLKLSPFALDVMLNLFQHLSGRDYRQMIKIITVKMLKQVQHDNLEFRVTSRGDRVTKII